LKEALKSSIEYIQYLHLSKCSLDDAKINAFFKNVNLFNINELILGKNTAVSPLGWSILRNSILNANCLNRLDLLDCSIDDNKLKALFDGI